MESRRERGHFEQGVAEAFVIRTEGWDASAECAEPDRVATEVAGESFGLCEDPVTESGALLRRVDREEAEVAACVGGVWFEVDAGEQIFGGVFGFVEQEFSFCHEVADAGVVDAVVVEDRAFDDEGGVDEARDGGDASAGGDAQRETRVGRCSIRVRRWRHDDQLCI